MEHFLHRYIGVLQQLTALCFPLAVAIQVSQPLGWGRSWEHHKLLLLDKLIRSTQISVWAPSACYKVALQYSLGYREGKAWGGDAGSDPCAWWTPCMDELHNLHCCSLSSALCWPQLKDLLILLQLQAKRSSQSSVLLVLTGRHVEMCTSEETLWSFVSAFSACVNTINNPLL